jgi:hypothetical protein
MSLCPGRFLITQIFFPGIFTFSRGPAGLKILLFWGMI